MLETPFALLISNIWCACCSVLQCRLHVPYYRLHMLYMMARRLVTSRDSMTSYL